MPLCNKLAALGQKQTWRRTFRCPLWANRQHLDPATGQHCYPDTRPRMAIARAPYEIRRFVTALTSRSGPLAFASLKPRHTAVPSWPRCRAAPRRQARRLLLQRLLAAGLSRYEPDPLRALAEAAMTLVHRLSTELVAIFTTAAITVMPGHY